MTKLLVFDTNEELILIYNSSEHKYIYITDEFRTYRKDNPLDTTLFRQQSRLFKYYKNTSEETDPVEITRATAYAYLGFRVY
jgi:site-specific DNA-adenine methylase